MGLGLKEPVPGDTRALIISASIMLFFVIAGKIVNALQRKPLGILKEF